MIHACAIGAENNDVEGRPLRDELTMAIVISKLH